MNSIFNIRDLVANNDQTTLAKLKEINQSQEARDTHCYLCTCKSEREHCVYMNYRGEDVEKYAKEAIEEHNKTHTDSKLISMTHDIGSERNTYICDNCFKALHLDSDSSMHLRITLPIIIPVRCIEQVVIEDPEYSKYVKDSEIVMMKHFYGCIYKLMTVCF